MGFKLWLKPRIATAPMLLLTAKNACSATSLINEGFVPEVPYRELELALLTNWDLQKTNDPWALAKLSHRRR